MPVAGFVEPWSVATGAKAKVFLSSIDADASFRIVSVDRDEREVFDWPFERHSPRFQVREYELGSWLELPAISPQAREWDLRFEVLFTKNDTPKPVCSIGDTSVWLDGPRLEIRSGGLRRQFADILPERWYDISARHASDNRIVFSIATPEGTARSTTAVEGFGAAPGSCWMIGNDGTSNGLTLNARVGRIGLSVDGSEFSWHFPRLGPVESLGSNEDESLVLRIHNMPTFSVASCRFTAEVHDPRLEPTHFDAVHLHDDDFGGFDWSADLTVGIPANARSGVFAVEVSTSQGTERLPFFVRAEKPRSALAFLVPTSSYLAYADERLPPVRYPWHGSDRGHVFAIDNGFLSLYDVHSDFSGVSLVNARRPRATVRDDYHYPLSNGPHHLSVDLHLLRFYARQGIDIEIVTDRDLHDNGQDALAGYRGVLSGSHPEYWSTPMMKAFDGYLHQGGNFAYLGGNGFYWVVAHQGETMELRRVKSDIWSGRPGEHHMSITGEPGGNWEDRGLRNPQCFLGITFLIMSFGPSRPYRRLDGSFAPEAEWLFKDVADEPIGDSGVVAGGAGGYEIDAVVRSELSPKTLVRLATADGFDDSFQVRPDLWLVDGDAERETLRRADMTIYRHSGGGHVFSTGSVAWLGALPGPGEENNVGRIMRNLAEGFANH